jgi:CubicO group peptidase (beta-lactamase class C family)
MRADILHAATGYEAFPGAALTQRCGGAFVYLEVRANTIVGPVLFAPADSALRADSSFWLGCVSKPLVATAVLLLVDRGELTLDDRLARFIPDAPAPARDVTIEQLLAHTSGFPRNVPGEWSFFDDRWLAMTLERAVVPLLDCVQPTGGARLYSSVGYAVLGRVVETATSMELGAFLAEAIFAPLGMSDSCCINDMPARIAERAAPVVASSHGLATVVFDPRSQRRILNSMPFAGFFASAVDLARFLQLYFDRGGSLLREETVVRVCRERVLGQGIHQGLGWFLAFGAPRAGETQPCGVWHSASNGSLVAADLDRCAAVIVLGQSLLEEDLVPVRVAEWMYVERALDMRPRHGRPEVADTPLWMTQLSTAGRDALST